MAYKIEFLGSDKTTSTVEADNFQIDQGFMVFTKGAKVEKQVAAFPVANIQSVQLEPKQGSESQK